MSTAKKENKEGGAAGFHGIRMFIESEGSGGGHIGRNGKSLCGVEARFPNKEVECDFYDDEFTAWFADNAPWICRTCMKTYTKLNPAHP